MVVAAAKSRTCSGLQPFASWGLLRFWGQPPKIAADCDFLRPPSEKTSLIPFLYVFGFPCLFPLVIFFVFRAPFLYAFFGPVFFLRRSRVARNSGVVSSEEEFLTKLVFLWACTRNREPRTILIGWYFFRAGDVEEAFPKRRGGAVLVVQGEWCWPQGRRSLWSHPRGWRACPGSCATHPPCWCAHRRAIRVRVLVWCARPQCDSWLAHCQRTSPRKTNQT